MTKIPLILLMLALAVFAQTKTATKTTSKPRPAPATVSGRVFLITKAGDLKPARMASVYLFFVNTAAKTGETASEADSRHLKDGHTAGSEWAHQNLAVSTANLQFAVEQSQKWKESNYAASSETMEKIKCAHSLALSLQALAQTTTWAKTNNKMSQALNTEADEEGNFKLSIPNPGVWEMFAYGHAGLNDAFWGGVVGNDLIVEAGLPYTVKLSSPEIACVAAE